MKKTAQKLKDEAEYYFIQLLFCENRDLLRVKYRELFDSLFKQYHSMYVAGKVNQHDVMEINKLFMGRSK